VAAPVGSGRGAATTVRGATRRPPPRGAPHRPGREAADLAGSAPASGLCRLWPRACGAAGRPGAGADGPLAARRGAPCASARVCCSVARGGGVWHDGRVLARAPHGAGAPPGPLAAPPGPRNQPRGGGACGPPLLGPAPHAAPSRDRGDEPGGAGGGHRCPPGAASDGAPSRPPRHGADAPHAASRRRDGALPQCPGPAHPAGRGRRPAAGARPPRAGGASQAQRPGPARPAGGPSGRHDPPRAATRGPSRLPWPGPRGPKRGHRRC